MAMAAATVSAFIMPTEYGMMQRIAIANKNNRGDNQHAALEHAINSQRACDGAFGYCNSWG